MGGPHFRPELREGERDGLDVSNHQGVIDWEQTGEPSVLSVLVSWEGPYPSRGLDDRPIWHRRIGLRPETDGWWIWQASYQAEVDGVSGGVDLNVMAPGGP